jgi:hypothetical protein
VTKFQAWRQVTMAFVVAAAVVSFELIWPGR